MVMFALSALAKDLAGLTITLNSPQNSNSSSQTASAIVRAWFRYVSTATLATYQWCNFTHLIKTPFQSK